MDARSKRGLPSRGTGLRLMVALLAAVAMITVAGDAGTGAPGRPVRAAPDSAVTGTSVVARAPDLDAVNDQITSSIKDKQEVVVDQTCDALDAVIEDLGESAGAMASGDLASHQARCAVARRQAAAVTTEDIEAMAVTRWATATVFAEYTGPDRDDVAGGASAPSWEPGGPGLRDVLFLGQGYAYDGDGDGVCNARGRTAEPLVSAGGPSGHGKPLTRFSEWCAEVVGDGVGDDDGFCETQNPPGKEKSFDERCVTVEVSFDQITSDPANIDQGRLADLDALLGEAATTATSFNGATRRVLALLASAPVSDAPGALGCTASVDRLKEKGIALGIMTGLADGLEATANVTGQFSNQTVVAFGAGGNGSATTAWLFGVAGAARVVATSLEVTADADTATNVTSILDCLDAFRGETDQAMDGLSEDVAALAEVSLQVVQLKEKASYLVSAAVSGRPVAGVDLVALTASPRNPMSFRPVPADAYRFTPVDGASGLYTLDLALPQAMSSTALLSLLVEFQGPDGPVSGSINVDLPTR